MKVFLLAGVFYYVSNLLAIHVSYSVDALFTHFPFFLL